LDTTVYDYLKDANLYIEIAFRVINQEPDSDHKNTILSGVYNNLGILSDKQGDLNKASEYYNKSIDLIIHSKNYHGLYLGYVNLGIVYKKQKDITKAMDAYNKALDYAFRSDNKVDVAVVYVNLGQMYLLKNNVEKANSYFQKAYDVSVLIKSYRLQRKSLYGLYKCADAKGDKTQALDYYIQYAEIKDLLFNETMANQITEMETKYKLVEKESEKQLLIKENQLIQKRFTYLTIFSLIVLTLSSLVFYQKKNIKTKNKKLLQKNITELQVNKEEISNKNKLPIEEDLYYELVAVINTLFEKEKIYLNSDINLLLLSEKANSNKNYLSKVLNHHYGKSFTNIINEYRINEAQNLLIKQNKKYTIDSIGKQVGFKSKSVFYKSFKGITGLTPNEYIKTLGQISD